MNSATRSNDIFHYIKYTQIAFLLIKLNRKFVVSLMNNMKLM